MNDADAEEADRVMGLELGADDCLTEPLRDLSRLHNAEVYDRSIDVQILRLRRKIEPDPSRPPSS